MEHTDRLSVEANLRKTVHRHLRNLGFSKKGSDYIIEGKLSKQRIRNFHAEQRKEVLKRDSKFIEKRGPDLVQQFASGTQIDPELIDPELVEVKSKSNEAMLFRFASLLWSVPVSKGFGRRIRFIVRDRYNGKLIGLLAIGDPVYNLSARDKWIGWTFEDRKKRLTHVMDAYVVGAVPPYSKLIGGKLVAALLGSVEIKLVYDRKYLGRQAVISGKENRARLVLLTTTSAMGRSSMYNRLSIPEGPNFIKIGETRGYGHFHLSGHVFEKMREYLNIIEHPYASGYQFGMGPNWRIRVARAALDSIGVNADSILNHGIAREVYAIPLAQNWQNILKGKHRNVRSSVRPASEIIEYCLNRWIIPRASRNKNYKEFERRMILEHLRKGSNNASW